MDSECRRGSWRVGALVWEGLAETERFAALLLLMDRPEKLWVMVSSRPRRVGGSSSGAAEKENRSSMSCDFGAWRSGFCDCFCGCRFTVCD